MSRADTTKLRTTSATRGPRRVLDTERNFLPLVSLPALVLMLGVTAIPFAATIGLAFTNYDPLRSSSWGFVGLNNFLRLAQNDNLPTIMYTTFYFVAATVILETVLGLGLAVLLTIPLRAMAVARLCISSRS